MDAWKNNPDFMATLLKGRYGPAVQDPDLAKMEKQWHQDIMSEFKPADRDILLKPDAFQSAIKVFRPVYSLRYWPGQV